MTENQTNTEQSLITTDAHGNQNAGGEQERNMTNERINDLKAQAQNYGQQFQDAAMKAKDFASEKFAVAGDKFKELQNKDPKELVEEAKEYARQKPGHALAVSAVVGLVLGLILRGGGRK